MKEKEERTYEQDITGDGIYSLEKVVEARSTEGNCTVKYTLIGISVMFLFTMLALPLLAVAVNALKEGAAVYRESVLDEYTVKAFPQC